MKAQQKQLFLDIYGEGQSGRQVNLSMIHIDALSQLIHSSDHVLERHKSTEHSNIAELVGIIDQLTNVLKNITDYSKHLERVKETKELFERHQNEDNNPESKCSQ